MRDKTIAVFVGSIRRESYNRLMAQTLMKVAPSSLRLEIVEIGALSMYCQDLDEQPPMMWTELRGRVRKADGVLFVTPEYNRSVPGVLKNAIDILSRPYGQNAFDGKPGAVMSVSVGAIGGFGANHHLRQTLMYLNVPVLQQPEAYIGHAAELFDGRGNLVNESTREHVTKFMLAYAAWVELVAAKKA
jgi:chromate reductase, NAD(P)H dehydrogenase (quinone)